ncbi:MAG: hypothetical protein JF614_16860 [Acidobacteria bacterium]|nr:hypothetical protein [Acidobacteriota bacterium]
MPHVVKEVLGRVLAGQGGEAETGRVVQHLLECGRCRTLAAGRVPDRDSRSVRPKGPAGSAPLGVLRQVYELEQQKVVEALLAGAEWAELRRNSSRRSQRDHVRMSKACHTWAFLDVLLSEVRAAGSRDESEFIASLALLGIQGMEAERYPQDLRNDLTGTVWIEVANVRRIAAEWVRAEAALQQAERLLLEGTGDPLLQGKLLSIQASVRADQGHGGQAIEILDRCKALYAELEDWPLLARTLVQAANLWAEAEPGKGLTALAQALPLIPRDDTLLRLQAESLRAECLIGTGQLDQALRVFSQAEPLRALHRQPRIQLKSKFTGAQLLEALGKRKEAEKVFEEVIAGELEEELYKDAFLDLLYLFEFHFKAGSLERAAEVCRRALSQLAMIDFNEQLSVVWTQLLEATQRQAVDTQALSEARAYLRVHWSNPAAEVPKPSGHRRKEAP